MKAFISIPMNGRTTEEITNEIHQITEDIKSKCGSDTVIIDSMISNQFDDTCPLYYLGKSLELMSQADVAYFAKDWNKYRGCVIEHIAALKYDIEIIHD